MTKNLIVLDADGVLLDYNLAYASAWESAFGNYPSLRNPNAYWAKDRWEVKGLQVESLSIFRNYFDMTFWSSIPAIEGSVSACQSLSNAGFELVCVTALSEKYKTARQSNLFKLGFPIETVITVEHTDGSVSPKAAVINSLKPIAFVDDFLPYMLGVNANIHRALITRDPEGSPNTGELLKNVNSQHKHLEDFAMYWLGI